MAPCRIRLYCQRFGDPCGLHLQGEVTTQWLLPILMVQVHRLVSRRRKERKEEIKGGLQTCSVNSFNRQWMKNDDVKL